MKSICLSLALAAGLPLCLALPVSTAHAIPVFDSANYTQNILTAARTLQQINQQIQSLQNEAQMLLRMDKNLARTSFPELEQLKANLQKVESLMADAKNIGFSTSQMDARLNKLFPGGLLTLDRSGRVMDAKTRLDAAMASFKRSMNVQARIVEDAGDDARALSAAAARSQGAEGALAVSQATNQLLTIIAKQSLQFQQMMAAEFQSAGVERARAAQAEAEAREMTKRFLGSGKTNRPKE